MLRTSFAKVVPLSVHLRPVVATAAPLVSSFSSSNNNAAMCTSSTVSSTSSSASVVALQRRSYVNALFRKPIPTLYPTHTKDGTEINIDKIMREREALIEALEMTDLTDKVFEMSSLPYLDALYPSDLIASYQDMYFPMPKYAVEHRAKEISDILRYMKSYGSAGDFNHTLQDTPGARAVGGDFVNIPTGLLIGYGKDRATNEIAFEALTDTTVKVNDHMSKLAFPIFGVPLANDAPPLGDIIGFGGQRTIFYKDTTHGEQASKVIAQTQNRMPWQMVKLEADCEFLTFAGAKAVYDVIVDINADESIERIGEAGFHAYPIDWSEHKKMGVSMRRLMLIARFALGSFSGGIKGHDHKVKKQRTNLSNTAGTYKGGERVFGDTGAPLEAQIRSKEIPQPVYQPPPRYRPPMHRGGLQTYSKEWADNTGDAGNNPHPGDDKESRMRRHYWEANSPYPKENASVNTHATMSKTRTGVQPPDPINTRRF